MTSLIKSTGLSSYESELTDTSGLDQADNVVNDEPYVIEKRRGQEEVGTSLPLTTDRISQVLTYKNRILRHYNSILQFDSTGSYSFSNFSGTYGQLESGLRLKSQEANGNLYFTNTNGINKISARTSSDFLTSANYITKAGGIKALDLEGKVVFTTSGFFPPSSKVAYRLVFASKDKNNIIQVGTPSARVVITNNSTPSYVPEVSTISVGGALTSSEYILLDAKGIGYFVWFDNTGSDAKPQTSETLNRTEIHVNLVGTTTNDQRASAIANVIGTVSDFTVEVNSSIVTITLSDDTSDDVPDIAEQSGGTSNISVATLAQGSVTEGNNATVELNFLIPQAIITSATPTNFFFQVYRTAVVTTSEGVTITDIDPGDECQQVYESFLTSGQITAGEVTFTDISPETFREVGPPLYTNAVTGTQDGNNRGIITANEPPPIAKDIELFRNYMFYGNTKSVHRLNLDILSVIDFTSGISDVIIGNSTNARTYSFAGTKESFDITVDSRTNTTSGGYILFYSANDETEYLLWFDKTGADSAPSVIGKQKIRVDISSNAGVPDTAAGTAAALINALQQFPDFSMSLLTPVITVYNTNNGNSTNASIGGALGGAWLVNNIVNGTGEDTSLQIALLSAFPSASQAIEQTARSLVKVINADPSSIVNAYYISGEDDLPGKITIESRTLTDDPFFVFTSDANITNNFNPELNLNDTITAINFSIGINSPALIESVGHGLFTGDEVYIYSTATLPVIRGKFAITVTDVDHFTIPFIINTEDDPSTAFFVLADTSSDNTESPNRIYFSKLNFPEAVPLLNYLEIGTKDKSIQRILALRDNLFVLKEDGVYIVTGSSSPFTARLLDSSTQIIAPDSAVVLNNQIYALTTQGIVSITESGVGIISRSIENKITSVTRNNFNFKYPSFGVGYETDRAYILFLPTLSSDTVATQAYRYNTINRTWTRWTFPATCGVIANFDNKMYLGPADRSYLTRERKDLERTDYADRDFLLTIPTNAVNDNVVDLSNVQFVVEGDSLVQEQYVSISFFNRMLRRLDRDNGLDMNYVSSIGYAVNGDSMHLKLDALNAKLLADDVSGAITDHSPFSTDITIQKNSLNSLIAELNGPVCDSTIKDYEEVEDLVYFETIVTNVSRSNNKVTCNFSMPFLVGDIRCYKAIKSEFAFNYQTFGTPDEMKQIKSASVILDQNNFYELALSFKTDVSPSYEEISMLGHGVGTWGYPGYGDFNWGGNGTDEGIRVIVPQDKQRCRYIAMKIGHNGAREGIRCLGISMQARTVSDRAYRNRK